MCKGFNIKVLFLNKIVKEFNLVKSKIEARDNSLHLDCCFQPVKNDNGIIYKNGLLEETDYLFLVNLFGKESLFHITRGEMYDMNSNVFSIDTNVVVSKRSFTRQTIGCVQTVLWLKKFYTQKLQNKKDYCDVLLYLY